jgi:hypothetical protein
MSTSRRKSARDRFRIQKPEDVESPARAVKPEKQESASSRLKKVGILLDPDLHYELKRRAVAERRMIFELIDEALRRYLEQEGGDDRTT